MLKLLCKIKNHKLHIRQEFSIASDGMNIRYKKYCPICEKNTLVASGWKVESYSKVK